MSDGDIDYSKYSLRELKEALDGINREKYPENFRNLRRALAALSAADVDVVAAPGSDRLQTAGDQLVDKYAGFWLRFGAMCIDSIAFLPWVLVSYLVMQRERLAQLYLVVPSVLVQLWFYVYLVARYGGTPGKLALNMRVAMLDESPVTLKAAFIRNVVQLVFSILTTIALILASTRMTDAEYDRLGFIERSHELMLLAPFWFGWARSLSEIWFWSEFFTLLFNKKKRAIHDFIAGTVVILVQPNDRNDLMAARRSD